jgi:hypothetical protein
MEELPTSTDLTPADGVGQEAVVADSDEAAGEHVEKETLEELDRSQSHDLLLVSVSAVLPAERDLILLHGNQALIGERDPVRVASQVIDNLVRAGHGRLRVDHPILSCGRREGGRNIGSLRCTETTRTPGFLEGREKLSTEDDREDLHGEEEAGFRGDPPVACGGGAAAGDDRVDVGVKEQGLGPGVQDRDKPDPGAEILGGRRDFGKSLGNRSEEEVVAEPCVGKEERVKLLGDGKDGVVVLDGEDVLLPRFHPAGFVEGLALGTVAIAAGIVPDLQMPTRLTGLDVAPERRGTAARDRPHSPLLLGGEPQKAVAVRAEDVGQLQATGRRPWSVHRQRLGGTERESPVRSSSGLLVSSREAFDT